MKVPKNCMGIQNWSLNRLNPVPPWRSDFKPTRIPSSIILFQYKNISKIYQHPTNHHRIGNKDLEQRRSLIKTDISLFKQVSIYYISWHGIHNYGHCISPCLWCRKKILWVFSKPTLILFIPCWRIFWFLYMRHRFASCLSLATSAR